ncbi:anti-phage-associated DUF3780 domain-containing protein [Nostoc punctiforme UO1]|uniref:anti-phage-associated DUF3780 domain-containing protein n=1 Tax=Nostoc punctiforme TaxID=272131 RepID=UPI0030971F7A
MTNSTIKRATVGFGCPITVDPHHFVVELPAGRTAPVIISEVYGIKAGLNGLPDIAERCHLPRAIWSLIAEDVKREFNERLRSKKITTSRWTTGINKMERLLGKELLVLAWAIERANQDTVPNAIRNWTGLRPEERWWLYTVTAAATGGPEHADIGWRKALRHALTENPLAEITSIVPVKRSRLLKKSVTVEQPSLFDIIQEEPSPFLSNAGREVFVEEEK